MDDAWMKDSGADYSEELLARKPMTMRGWIAKLDDFPRLGDRDILRHAGRVSADMAKIKAQAEYDKWHDRRLNQPGAVDASFSAAIW
ncbi:RhuM family protein [Brevundimonas sp. 3P9-tot-E]|uniref:RhuM family protein n=1 Tax=Brevundimonas TaxID=41275 RepID=UPI0034D4CD76